MDAKSLYPRGFHPQRNFLTVDARGRAPVRHRYQASFPQYYFIDFGISTWFREDHQGPRLVTGGEGQDKSVPELHATNLYDPFKVDIFTLGNLYKIDFISVRTNVFGFDRLLPGLMHLPIRDRNSMDSLS